MSKDITLVTTAITSKPKKGKPITSNEFLLEFDIDVDKDGCYVILVEVLEDDTFSDDIILDNTDVFLPAHCLSKGSTQRFRITTSNPAPKGTTPPSAPKAGTIELPTLQGSWPTDDGLFDSDIEIKFKITVYYIGPCKSGKCQKQKQEDLELPYMELIGPQDSKWELDLIERELVAFRQNVGQNLAIVNFTPSALLKPLAYHNLLANANKTEAKSGSLQIKNNFVAYNLRYVRNDNSFGEDAVEVNRYSINDKGENLTGTFMLKDLHPSLESLGQALLTIDEAYLERDMKTIAKFSTLIVRHGLSIKYTSGFPEFGVFFQDRFDGVWNTQFQKLTNRNIFFSPPGGAVPVVKEKEKVSDDVWMTDEWYVYPFAWIFAGSDYADDIDELISDTLDPVIKGNKCLEELEIMSHGGELVSGNGTVTGSRIMMGSDELRSTDFDANGNLKASSKKTKKLLDKLKKAMCPGGKIIFSACNQKIGDLLKNISKYLGNDITVVGNSGTGVPEIEGDLKFKNGALIK